MLDETTQSTDVSTATSPGAVSESTDTSASSVAQSGEQAIERSGDVTAQPAAVEAKADEQEGSTPPPSEEADPFEGVPSIDELRQQAERKVPYSEALLRLRTALEARNSEVEGLKGRVGTAEPVLPLIEQHGGAEAVQARLEAYNSLFTPVVNPETKQPEVDPATGFPRITTAPFIERVDAENPGMAEQLLFDALNYEAEFGAGEKVRLYRHPAVQAELLKAYGLDPQRLDDYRNIDARPAHDAGVTPEELTNVPDEFHETYKALPPGVRSDLQQQDDDTRRFNLEAHKERFDRKAQETERQAAEAQNRQQQEAQVRQYVAQEQDSFVNTHFQESHALLMDDLARQVTFSEDAAANAQMHGIVGLALVALRDRDAQFAASKTLEALGVKVDEGFFQALADADRHLRDARAYELFGQKGFAQAKLTEANGAKKLALAKTAPIALRIAQALGGQVVSKAKKQNGAIDGATRTRPVPGGDDGEEGGGILPAGMLPTDPGAGIYLARQSGLLGG